jgi:hypothetical protein
MKINLLFLLVLLAVEKILATVIYAEINGGIRWPDNAASQFILIIFAGLKLDVVYGRALLLALLFTVKKQLFWLKYSSLLILPISHGVLYIVVRWLQGADADWAFKGTGIGGVFVSSAMAASLVCAPFYGWLIHRSQGKQTRSG